MNSGYYWTKYVIQTDVISAKQSDTFMWNCVAWPK